MNYNIQNTTQDYNMRNLMFSYGCNFLKDQAIFTVK